GDIADQPLDAHGAAGGVALRPRGLLQPHLSAVGAHEAKDDRCGTVDAGAAMVRLETLAVVRMNPREELLSGESLRWANAQDLRSVLAALRQAAANITLEGHHCPGR